MVHNLSWTDLVSYYNNGVRFAMVSGPGDRPSGSGFEPMRSQCTALSLSLSISPLGQYAHFDCNATKMYCMTVIKF